MIYNFDAIPERRSTESIKWHYYDEDVLPMWVADMDFPSPEPVVRALTQRALHGVYGYPKELPAFRPLVLERLERLYGWRVAPEAVVFLPGVVTGFNIACHALAAPNGSMLVQTPVYPPMLGAPAHANLQRQENELVQRADGAYEIDMDSFRAALTPDTNLFMLCNPHNPVGRVFRQEELEAMAHACLQKGVTICSDEIHCDLLFRGHRHIPVASLDPEIALHTITLMAPSKTFNIAGLECSLAVIPDPDLRQRFQHAYQGLVGGINLMGWVAGLAAYQDGQEWLDQLLVYLECNRDFMITYLRQEMPEIVVSPPEGTYLAWLDCRALQLPCSPAEFFLKNARVGLNDGATFGSPGQGFVRLNFGCPQALLAEALERMKMSLSGVQ